MKRGKGQARPIQFAYIDGEVVSNNRGLTWTAAEIDMEYAILWKSRGCDNPPPNEWYPLNILGFSKYSITKRGEMKRNTSGRHIKGAMHGGRLRFGITNDNTGKKEQKYADELVAGMFLGAPPACADRPRVGHRDDDRFNSKVSNLEWKTWENTKEMNGKSSAKVVHIHSTSASEAKAERERSKLSEKLISYLVVQSPKLDPKFSSFGKVPLYEHLDHSEEQLKNRSDLKKCARDKVAAEKDFETYIEAHRQDKQSPDVGPDED
jgi:hypothetical protein